MGSQLRDLVSLRENVRNSQRAVQESANRIQQFTDDLVEAGFNGRIFVHPRYMAEALAYAREHDFEHMILNQEDPDYQRFRALLRHHSYLP